MTKQERQLKRKESRTTQQEEQEERRENRMIRWDVSYRTFVSHRHFVLLSFCSFFFLSLLLLPFTPSILILTGVKQACNDHPLSANSSVLPSSSSFFPVSLPPIPLTLNSFWENEWETCVEPKVNDFSSLVRKRNFFPTEKTVGEKWLFQAKTRNERLELWSSFSWRGRHWTERKSWSFWSFFVVFLFSLTL